MHRPEKLAELYMQGILQRDRALLEAIYMNEMNDGYIDHQLNLYGGYDLHLLHLRIGSSESSYFKSLIFTGVLTDAAGNQISVKDYVNIQRQGDDWYVSWARY